MNKIISFISLCLLFSCSEKPVSIPDDVISRKEMTEILTDMHLAQAAIGDQSKTDSVKITMNEYSELILKQHNLKKEDLIRSLKFYSQNPAIFGEVYDSVITSLSRLEGEFQR